jgi:cobalt/nickel transport system permease protein
MHIPDSMISPETCAVGAAVMAPVWFVAGKQLRRSLPTKHIPLLAIGTAFCFTIMMFNIPVPGGTTVHPVGAVLLAVLLGPPAAIIGVTAALVVQALFFMDGGALAIGVNSFTMAFSMPICGWFVYTLISGRTPSNHPRRAIAAGIASWIGLNVAAFITAFVLGIQPILYHDASGRALYFPFPLSVSIPAMLFAHMAFAGVAEAIVTASVVRYMQSRNFVLYGTSEGQTASKYGLSLLWAGLGVMAALTPLGILAKGDAFGEWGVEGLKKQAGYLPAGFLRVERYGWKGFALFPDYLSDKGPLFYILSAVIGIALASGLILLVAKLFVRNKSESSPDEWDGGEPRGKLRAGELPEWLLRSPKDDNPKETQGGEDRTMKRGWLDKTLEDLSASWSVAMQQEKTAKLDGALQRLDPRTKVVSLLLLSLAAVMCNQAYILAGLLFFAWMLALLSKLPMPLFFKRVVTPVAFFILPIAIPSTLNWVHRGHALLTISSHPYICITLEGSITAGMFLMRMLCAVSFVALLSSTTVSHQLFEGMGMLMVPRTFLWILEMTYRYMLLLLRSAEEMFLARKSRTVHAADTEEARRFLSASMGALFVKSMNLTEDIHGAMRSRGWGGETRFLRRSHFSWRDLTWGGLFMLVFLSSIIGGFIG